MVQIETKNVGYYTGYHSEVAIKHSVENDQGTVTDTITFNTNNDVDLDYNVVSNDSPSLSTSNVTIYNVSQNHLNSIHVGDWITVKSGPTSLFGVIGAGMITEVSPEVINGTDRATTITFQEGTDYTNISVMKTNYNGTKTVTINEKDGSVKTFEAADMNMSFPSNTKASEIIGRIINEAKITVSLNKLANDITYNNGYTVSAKPYNALTAIANDCGSKLYYRPGGILVIDDCKDPNPFNEHIKLSDKEGNITLNGSKSKDDSGVTIYTFSAFDDPRVGAGTYLYIDSSVLNGFHRVKAVTHKFTNSDGPQMEVTSYA